MYVREKFRERKTYGEKILQILIYFQYFVYWYYFQFSSVTQSCLTLCDPMDCRYYFSILYLIINILVFLVTHELVGTEHEE